MEAIFFYSFAALAIGMVLLMIFQENPVASAVCLVTSFFGLAGLYALLQAHFIAVLQILVYAGAIMVLFIFVIMLLNLRDEDIGIERLTPVKIAAIVIGLFSAGFFAYLFLKIPKVSFNQVSADFGTAKPLGQLMFSDYIIPFELIGLLLLVGIVGAILLGRREG